MSRIYTFTETRQMTNLLDSIKKGDEKLFISLIHSYGINKVLDASGNTSLHYAIMFHQYEIIKYLISNGANDKIKNVIGDDCSTLACRYLNPKYFELDSIFHMQEIGSLRRTLISKTNDMNKLESTLIHWKSSYEKLNKKYIALDEENEELKKECSKQKRKISFLEESYSELCKKRKN